MDVLQLTNNKTIMKENLIKPYCCCGESENSLVDNAIFVYFSEEYRRVLPHKSNGGECNRLITNKKQNI